MRHQLLDIDAALLADDEARRLFMIGLIPQIVDLRQLLVAHLRRNLLQDLAPEIWCGNDVMTMSLSSILYAARSRSVPLPVA